MCKTSLTDANALTPVLTVVKAVSTPSHSSGRCRLELAVSS